MAFPDRIFQYYSSDMLPSGTPEDSPDTLTHDADMPTTLQQPEPKWRSVEPALISPSPNIINPSPNFGPQMAYAPSKYTNNRFSVMYRTVPIHQELAIRQRATPHQPNDQGYSFVSQTTLPPHFPPWDYAEVLACAENYRSHQPNDLPSEALKCDWEGCRYTGTFGRKAELKRHQQTQHINPKAYKCPKCGRPCNRNDNLNGHLRKVHGSDI